jgi:cytochrome P450
MTARVMARWAATHGLMRLALNRGARQGNLDARLMVDPAYRADPFPYYEQLRETYPLVKGGLAWASVHHDVCTEVLRSEDFGVARPDLILPPPARAVLKVIGTRTSAGPIDPPSMLAVDPPDHTRYRKLVSRVFTAKAVAGLRERTAIVADELLDELASGDRGEPVDLVAGYASLLPVTVISEILGVPVTMREQFLQWGDGAAASLDLGLPWSHFQRSEADLDALHEWFLGHFARLRATPGEDILSQLVALVDDDGGRLSEPELSATALLLLGAGFETTVNLIGNGVAALFAHSEQRAALADDPSLWPNAVEEVLRFDSPVQRTARRAKRDTEVHGVPVQAGNVVVTMLGGANRDPRKFDHPDRFDIHRANAREHVAFSSGIHYCLGAALAKMEGEVALRRLFERFPQLTPAGPAHRRPTRVLRGYDAMPVLTNARAVAH